MVSRQMRGVSDAERQELVSLWRLVEEAERTLHVMTDRLELVEGHQREVRRRLVPGP